MKKISLIIVALLFTGITDAVAFCGFYLAKADAKLFNKTSQVIIVRDGLKTVITMASDFSGDVKDFAMVIPVPEVLKRQNIRVADPSVFDVMDDYSAPRLVEYYDENPCHKPQRLLYSIADSEVTANFSSAGTMQMEKKSTVKIEAQYKVDEYEILILSAEESTGLESWLIKNGYKIPEGAAEVLEPYIKSNMKFFVAKVNLEDYKKSGFTTIRPLQVTFNSNKFMLPIRLGMANANGNQDMIVYALTKTGRVETTNYRTVKIPSNKNIPEFVQEKFSRFYADVYKRAWRREGKKAVFLEYSWDVSPVNTMKCDPCVGEPPQVAQLREAGVWWLTTSSDQWNQTVSGKVFFTRLHITYNRQNFPQDLVFQETPNNESYQGRYIITHPASGPFDCKDANKYLVDLQKRRQKELDELAELTGWDVSAYLDYPSKYSGNVYKEPAKSSGPKKNTFVPIVIEDDPGGPGMWPLIAMSILFTLMLLASVRKRFAPQQS